MADTDTYSSPVFLGRQPILGREQQLLAYELLFRGGPLIADNQARVDDPTQATATVITNTFTGLSINEALGAYQGFINVDQQFLFSDLAEALPPALIVLEILETVPPTPEVIERCRQLRDMGFSLAMDDVVKLDEAYRPLFELAEIIKVDVLNVDAGQLAALVAELKPFGKKLLAEKVESAEQVEECKRLGFDLFQGYYFAKPTIIVGKKLEPSQAALLRLLGLVMQDAETSDLENAFKLDPSLTVNMLRLTNSVGNGLAMRITSLRHAIALLGRTQLRRWLQLLIYTGKGHRGIDNPLLPLAATRGRLLELLVERLRPHDRKYLDQGFLVGIMSLMPALLDIPMKEILAQLPVAPSVSQALLEEDGLLGRLLRLALATEQTEAQVIEDALRQVPGITVEFLEDALRKACQWANNLGRKPDQ
ncbi:MAG: EAL domain-containing protein [Candidatus Accumulibacter sp.]|jgi:EAL and modified HD-GYP domain-containing signal transduction protein|nr:EAL domain-containing protein [Accumulibacter sp.]